jgi:hypothetical protein
MNELNGLLRLMQGGGDPKRPSDRGRHSASCEDRRMSSAAGGRGSFRTLSEFRTLSGREAEMCLVGVQNVIVINVLQLPDLSESSAAEGRRWSETLMKRSCDVSSNP